jgi:hypothetical protein
MGIIKSILNRLAMSFDLKNESFTPRNKKEYSKDLLIADFQQCMEMLRHYDIINWDLTKFAFGQMLVVIGACWTILCSNKSAHQSIIDVYNDGLSNYIIGAILILSSLFLLLVIMAILKNRTYFVKMSRYLNEHRNLALCNNDLGFENKSNMWHKWDFPKKIDYGSTQLYCFYLLAISFLVTLGFGLYSVLYYYACKNCICICTLIFLCLFGVILLRRIDKKE